MAFLIGLYLAVVIGALGAHFALHALGLID